MVPAKEYNVNEEDLLEAARYVAVDMKADLLKYFGIPVVIENGPSTVSLLLNMTDDENKKHVAAINNYIRNCSKNGREADDRIRRFNAGRDRLVAAFDDRLVIYLSIQGETQSTALPAAQILGREIYLNPFTWRSPKGLKMLLTDVCQDHTVGPYHGRAAITYSAVAIIFHELGHREGCLILEKSRCKGLDGSGMAQESTFEKANAEDVDKMLGAHPDIGLRITNACGLPGVFSYIDALNMVKQTGKPYSFHSPTQRPWLRCPDQWELRSGSVNQTVIEPIIAAERIGKEIKSVDMSVRTSAIFERINLFAGCAMSAMLSEAKKIQDEFGYLKLKEMRDLYAAESSDPRNPANRNGDPVRIAIDKVLHMGEDPTPKWLLADARRAGISDAEFILIQGKYSG